MKSLLEEIQLSWWGHVNAISANVSDKGKGKEDGHSVITEIITSKGRIMNEAKT